MLDDVAHLVGDVTHGVGVRADDAELDGKAYRRPEIEPVDTDARFGQRPIIRGLLDTRLDSFARLDILGDDHDLGESLVRQLRAQPEPEARRALADIRRVGRDVLVVLQQRFRLFHGFFRDVERRAFRQTQLQEQFGPFGQREELLLHVTETDDREQGPHEKGLQAYRAVERVE